MRYVRNEVYFNVGKVARISLGPPRRRPIQRASYVENRTGDPVKLCGPIAHAVETGGRRPGARIISQFGLQSTLDLGRPMLKRSRRKPIRHERFDERRNALMLDDSGITKKLGAHRVSMIAAGRDQP